MCPMPEEGVGMALGDRHQRLACQQGRVEDSQYSQGSPFPWSIPVLCALCAQAGPHLYPPYLYPGRGDVEGAFDLGAQLGHGG